MHIRPARALTPLAGLVAAAAAAGVALRVWVLASPLGGLDGDEAVWGLMARHAVHGELSTFFWGQAYGGTQETFLTVPLFAAAGSSILGLRLVPMLLFVLAALLVWRVGRRTVGEPAAVLGAAAFWIWPSYLVWKSTRAHGFYGAAAVLGLAILLLALRLRERPAAADLAMLGLALGLGLWATPQIAFVAMPALGWLGWRRPALIRKGWIVLAGALAGGSPWLAWSLLNDWDSLHAPFLRGHDTYFDHLRTFFYATLPSALGLRVPFSLDWLPGPVVGRALEAVAVAAVGWLLWRRRGRRELLLVVAAAYPLLQSLSPFAALNQEPRYLILLMPVAALLVGELLASRPAAAAAGLAALLTLSAAGLVAMGSARLPVPPVAGERVPAELGPVLETLRRAEVTRVLAHYSVAYRITFESGEAIVATPTSGSTRYPRHRRLVLASPFPAYVFVSGSREERAFSGELRVRGYRPVELGDWSVYLPPRTL